MTSKKITPNKNNSFISLLASLESLISEKIFSSFTKEGLPASTLESLISENDIKDNLLKVLGSFTIKDFSNDFLESFFTADIFKEWDEKKRIEIIMQAIDRNFVGTLSDLDNVTLENFIGAILNYLRLLMDKMAEPEITINDPFFGALKGKTLSNTNPEDIFTLKLGDLFTDINIDDIINHAMEMPLNVANLIRFYYIFLFVPNLFHLFKKFISKDSSSIWKEAYIIGLLQGKLGSLGLITDPRVVDMHYSDKSGEVSQKHWEQKRNLKEEWDDQFLDEIKKMAQEIWEQKPSLTHDKVKKTIENRIIADRIKKKNPIGNTGPLSKLISHIIRPIAEERGRLRGARLPTFIGIVKKVDKVTKHIVMKRDGREKDFVVRDNTKFRDKEMSFAGLKKGMRLSIHYRTEKDETVAVIIKVGVISFGEMIEIMVKAGISRERSIETLRSFSRRSRQLSPSGTNSH